MGTTIEQTEQSTEAVQGGLGEAVVRIDEVQYEVVEGYSMSTDDEAYILSQSLSYQLAWLAQRCAEETRVKTFKTFSYPGNVLNVSVERYDPDHPEYWPDDYPPGLNIAQILFHQYVHPSFFLSGSGGDIQQRIEGTGSLQLSRMDWIRDNVYYYNITGTTETTFYALRSITIGHSSMIIPLLSGVALLMMILGQGSAASAVRPPRKPKGDV